MKSGSPGTDTRRGALTTAGLACWGFLLLPAVSFAAFVAADKGTSSGQFLKLGAGARAAGMGEAYSSAADGADAVYWNPAALARIEGFSAAFMHAALPAGISYEFLGLGRSLGEAGALGLGAQYLSMPAIRETDASGFLTGDTLEPEDLAVTLAYAYSPGRDYSVGVAGKYVRSRIGAAASAFAGDIGFLGGPFRLRGKELNVSCGAQNLGGGLKYDEEAAPLPFNLRLGSALVLNGNWLLGLDLNFPRDNGPWAALGAEYSAHYGPATSFAGRLGFNSRSLGDLSGLGGISAGAGVRLGRYGLDYAFVPLGELGLTHRFSVTVEFGKPQPPPSGAAGFKWPTAAQEPAGAETAPLTALPSPPVSGEIRRLLAELRSDYWPDRRRAAVQLGKLKAAEAVEPLLELLNDGNDKVCGSAAVALGRIGDARALDPLVETLVDASAYVRAAAARGLGYLGDVMAADPLEGLLTDHDVNVRREAAAALAKLTPGRRGTEGEL